MWKSSNAEFNFNWMNKTDKPFVNPVVSCSYLYIFIPAKSPGLSQSLPYIGPNSLYPGRYTISFSEKRNFCYFLH